MAYRYTARRIDPATGDLVVPLEWIHDEDVVIQRVAVRFHFFRGNWFLDLLEGVPYFTEVLRKNPDRFIVSSLLKRVILSTPGIVAVTKFELAPVEASRVWSLTWEATCDTGRTLSVHSPRLRLDIGG